MSESEVGCASSMESADQRNAIFTHCTRSPPQHKQGTGGDPAGGAVRVSLRHSGKRVSLVRQYENCQDFELSTEIQAHRALTR